MEGLKKLSQILLVLPVGTLLYDLIYEWFINARVNIRSLQEWWTDLDKGSLDMARDIVTDVISSKASNTFFNLPAPVALLVLPVFFYILYRFIYLLRGEDARPKLGKLRSRR